jgi:hypothetical protein
MQTNTMGPDLKMPVSDLCGKPISGLLAGSGHPLASLPSTKKPTLAACWYDNGAAFGGAIVCRSSALCPQAVQCVSDLRARGTEFLACLKGRFERS